MAPHSTLLRHSPGGPPPPLDPPDWRFRRAGGPSQGVRGGSVNPVRPPTPAGCKGVVAPR
eukprot:11901617-Alexandrium_andersonii.AAC.1